jgi:hypothetical protein
VTFISQDALDYSNDAQMRVAVDTRSLQRRITLTLVAGTAEYELDDTVVSVLSVLDSAGDPIAPLQADDALTLISGGDNTGAVTITGYYMLEPGTIGFYPAPDTADTVQLYYYARPDELTSASAFEISGDAEALIERLVLAMRMDDDGQLEWAAYQESLYESEASRLRRLRVDEQPSRFAVAQ